jgi:hypothetical protein
VLLVKTLVKNILTQSSSAAEAPRQGAEHSPPYSAEVNNAWSCTSTPSYVCATWCLIKHTTDITYTFIKINVHIHRNNLKLISGAKHRLPQTPTLLAIFEDLKTALTNSRVNRPTDSDTEMAQTTYHPERGHKTDRSISLHKTLYYKLTHSS